MLARARQKRETTWLTTNGKRRKVHTLICKVCGDSFGSIYPKHVCCSKACGSKVGADATKVIRAAPEATLVRAEIRALKRIQAAHAPHRPLGCTKVRFAYCRWCGDMMPITQTTGHTCSDSCSVMMTRVRAWASDRGTSAIASGVVDRYKETISAQICKECGTEYIPTTSGRMYCSDRCASKRYSRIHTPRRRARYTLSVLYKHPKIDSVDPYAIFRRDKWTCYICGRNTPKRKRGTYEPSAPELEHIVPLSKGGAHNEHNLACSCRECNQSKSDLITFRCRVVNNDGSPIRVSG